jgi:hypothetical protein
MLTSEGSEETQRCIRLVESVLYRPVALSIIIRANLQELRSNSATLGKGNIITQKAN